MQTSQPNSGSARSLAWATLAAIIATLVVNTLSNIFPPGGQNVGEIANTVLAGVLITPANYAFIIWGLIYVGLLAYGTYQLGAAQQDPTIQHIDKWLIVACLAQVVWIFLFTLQLFWLSILAMLGILLPLTAIYRRLGSQTRGTSRQWRWRVQIPFSIYLGWIGVATVVNVASALYASGWGGFGLSDIAWTVIMILVATAIPAILIAQRSDLALTLVFVWAFAAIAVRQSAISPIWITAGACAVALLGWLAYQRRN